MLFACNFQLEHLLLTFSLKLSLGLRLSLLEFFALLGQLILEFDDPFRLVLHSRPLGLDVVPECKAVLFLLSARLAEVLESLPKCCLRTLPGADVRVCCTLHSLELNTQLVLQGGNEILV